MAKLGINTGSSPNDGTGDSLLQGAIKINSNFDEIYSAIGNGTTITNSIGFARTAGISTLSGYASTAGIATFAVNAGISSYSVISGLSSLSSYAANAGIATVALFAGNFSSIPDITVGVVTASSYNGSGVNLTGVVTSILAGSNVSIDRSGGNVTINSTASSAVSSQWATVATGIVTSSRVGIGTTLPISELHLNNGTLSITGSSGGIQMDNGRRITLGSGANSSIYYDSVDLRIDTSSSVRIGTGNNNLFVAVAGEGASLFYNGSRKLQTRPDGLDVTGKIDLSGNINALGNVSVGGTVSANGGLQLATNNQTLIGTSGTTGNIKMILGAPFFYDGTAWREFYLKEGIQVTQPADTEWDNVIYRNTFDSSLTDSKLNASPSATLNADLVTSPLKFGSKALRLQDGYVSYAHTSSYTFNGSWTIEGWFYWDTLPNGTGASSDILVSKTDNGGNNVADWAFGAYFTGSAVFFYWKNENHPIHRTSSGTVLGGYGASEFTNKWYHIALVRESSNGSIHLYVDGVESASTATNQVIDNNILNSDSTSLNLGYANIDSSQRFFDGLIDDLRISRVARYTSVGTATTVFTSPTGAYPVTGTLTGPFEPAYYGEITDLGDLYDVSSATPSVGQVLKWDGTQWSPASDLTSSGGSGIGLTDLSVTTNPVGINSLVYNNTTGTFTFTPASLVGYATETYVDNAVLGMATTSYVDNAIVGFITSGASGANLINLTGASAGIYGDHGNSAQITVDANGRITNITQVAITTDGAGVNVSGISTFNDNVSFGSTIIVDGSVRLTGINTTIVGTPGTAGDIKVIGGAPFFYDGTAWREFALTSGTPVTTQADTEWDNVVFRGTFDTNYTDSRFNVNPDGTLNDSIVTSPSKVGSGALRLQNGRLTYPHRSEYNFEGEWTIEGWFYWDTLPEGIGASSDILVSKTDNGSNNAADWAFGAYLSGSAIFFYWKNQNHPTHNTSSGTSLGGYATSEFPQKWHHIALVREPSNGSIHLYLNGVESASTATNQVIDNNIIDSNVASLNLGYANIDSSQRYFDGLIDDFRISTVARYASNFTPPTTALPTTGTLSSNIQPPGDKYGEIGLGTSPTWRGTSGVTVSRQSSGNYRVSFASSYTNVNDYFILTQSMDQGFASYVGIARSTTHVDFTINKQSDDAAVDTGSLSVQIKNHV